MGFNRHYKYAFSLTKERKTNMSTAALSDFVSDEVVGKSVKLLREYGLKVF